jgi:signal transduction histidine kinase
VVGIRYFFAPRSASGGGARTDFQGSEQAGDATAGVMLTRVIVTVRMCVIASVALLLVFGSVPVRGANLVAAWALVGLATGYGVFAATHLSWEQRSSRRAEIITITDGVLATAAFGVMGASHSPVIAVVVLVVVGAAIRLEPRYALAAAVVLAAAVWVLSIVVQPWNPLAARLQFATWWSFYLIFTVAVAGSLSLLAEWRQEAAISARAEALAERRAAEEEHDLRERLMASYQAQYDGLRIILHEFRTPVVSLHALAASLARDNPALSPGARVEAAALLLSHVEHFSGMLDGLADVARTEGSPLGVPQRRKAELTPLLLAAADAGGLRPPQLLLQVDPPQATAVVEVSRLRRIVTNLADNAVKHAGAGAVDLQVRLSEHVLELTFRDHGPGLTPQQLEQVTRKYVSLSGAGETTGLGLWIVEQLVRSLGGELRFSAGQGEGLDVRVTMPM